MRIINTAELPQNLVITVNIESEDENWLTEWTSEHRRRATSGSPSERSSGIPEYSCEDPSLLLKWAESVDVSQQLLSILTSLQLNMTFYSHTVVFQSWVWVWLISDEVCYVLKYEAMDWHFLTSRTIKVLKLFISIKGWSDDPCEKIL